MGALLLGLAASLGACGGGDSDKQPAATGAGGGATARGAQIFKVNCVVCHGETGKGDGLGAAALTVKPRDLTSEAYKYVDLAGSASEVEALEKYIRAGKVENGMPPFGHLPPADLRAVAEYVASIRPKDTGG